MNTSRTLWQHPDNRHAIQVLDQRSLPHEIKAMTLSTVEEVEFVAFHLDEIAAHLANDFEAQPATAVPHGDWVGERSGDPCPPTHDAGAGLWHQMAKLVRQGEKPPGAPPLPGLT